MKLSTFQSSFASAVLLFAAAPADLAAQANPVANGSIWVQESGGKRTFAFTAVEMPNGSVSGQGEINSRAKNARFHFAITSMFIAPGGLVVLAGPITEATGPGAPPVGFNAFFALRRKNGVVQTTGLGVAPPQFDTAQAIFAVVGPPEEDDYLVPDGGHLWLR